MSKASIRTVEKANAWLSTGEGLNGNTPFITGSALVFPGLSFPREVPDSVKVPGFVPSDVVAQCVNIDVPQVEIS